MMVIVNKKEIMENYTNSRFQNAIGWTTSIVLILLSLGLLVSGMGLG
jgi:Mn2+/Fe2+ NRAMP family transporter